MSAVACTLVSLCVSLILVSGLPAAKRLPLSHDSDDVLAGSDFLSVFMQRGDRLRTADRSDGPFEPHHLNSVSHKGVLMDLVKPYSDKYAISNIFKTAKYGYAVDEPTEAEDYQITTPGVIPTLEADFKTTTQSNELTTIDDIPTTHEFALDKSLNDIPIEEMNPTITTSEENVTKSTTQEIVTEKFEEKVISVRVSSSVARHSHRTIETSTSKSITEVVSHPKLVDDNLVSTLVTQEQPTITAVQRSEFAVEEASPDSGAAVHQEPNDHPSYERPEEVEGKVQEVSLYSNQQQRRLNGKLPVFEIHFHNPPAALLSNYGTKPEGQRSDVQQSLAARRKEFRQLAHYGSHAEPISYQSRVSSPTSDSSVKFYREHSRSSIPGVAETINQPVISEQYASAPYPQAQENQEQGNLKSAYNEESRERSYGEPEKVYGQPEVNYEVDEAMSVITNGKAHGVQVSTPSPTDAAAQNKFGYVVEGRNFRKYRVEERTADGFIVGEYGVVSHDDGSLRGVRYTADSTINPRLIYDTLVKFLSLK